MQLFWVSVVEIDFTCVSYLLLSWVCFGQQVQKCTITHKTTEELVCIMAGKGSIYIPKFRQSIFKVFWHFLIYSLLIVARLSFVTIFSSIASAPPPSWSHLWYQEDVAISVTAHALGSLQDLCDSRTESCCVCQVLVTWPWKEMIFMYLMWTATLREGLPQSIFPSLTRFHWNPDASS